ncbi:uncharacterized protein At3g61260-like [Salvia miltiorrhiza]|uniref:uncharacterized protein At3g61260-like n=1 Tax=Salvia miltiorrhiza TaxID=226208 RepID=UPI0025AD3037|nr:uncharacterized protein At3g61260-like [Salvia miltiorrhiza]XP_057811111.1 uncharacterized protein At3g61260-like [Salvia miltiorrhiza]
MRSIEDKGCLNSCPTEENAGGGSCMIFDFKKGGGGGGAVSRPSPHHRSSLGKPTPSKWDDAQKWLVNLSRGERNQAKASPRDSNADDRHLIASSAWAGGDEGEGGGGSPPPASNGGDKYKNVECDESVWRGGSKGDSSPKSVVRAICLRDMGTEMTPIGSKEPSRAATPIRAMSPTKTSSDSAGSVSRDTGSIPTQRTEESGGINGPTSHMSREGPETNSVKVAEIKIDDNSRVLNPLEARAAAWEEAERAKYTARYKREDMRIQAWENHQKKKAEMENRKAEVKAEQLKTRAKEKCNQKIATTRRVAEEKRAVAEAKLNENGIKTSERGDYIRRNGHLPSSFSFKLPFCCW